MVTSRWANKCLHIPEKWLFAFRFCSFLHVYSSLARVEFNRLVSSDLQILDSQGRLSPPEEELPSWVSPNQTLRACLVLGVYSGVSEFCFHCRRENQRGTEFNPTTSGCSSYERDLLLACLLTLRFIFRACWIQATFCSDTHVGVHVCRPHRYACHAHTHAGWWAPEGERWSDLGRSSVLKWNISNNW